MLKFQLMQIIIILIIEMNRCVINFCEEVGLRQFTEHQGETTPDALLIMATA